jgi:spermidine synthase
MIPWVQLDSAKVPGGADLRLMQRGTEFAIFAGPTPLMNSRMSSSEVILAEIACARLKDRRKIHMLIGGYGMGFTLRAALAGLGKDAHVTVAEIVPAVLDWARGPMRELTAGCLDDARVAIHAGDVGDAIAAARGGFDAILLDVDNGPDGLSRAANDRLYDVRGLEAARLALKPGGLLAVWSAAPSAAFVAKLGRAGFAVKARASSGKGVRHIIWVATGSRPAPAPGRPANPSGRRNSRPNARAGRGRT